MVVPPWMLAILASILVVLWQGIQTAGKYSGNWSGFFYVDTRSPLPAPIDNQHGVTPRAATTTANTTA